MKTLEFTICKDTQNADPSKVAYWVYEEVISVTKRTKYVVIFMAGCSAFIPIPWIVNIKEL